MLARTIGGLSHLRAVLANQQADITDQHLPGLRGREAAGRQPAGGRRITGRSWTEAGDVNQAQDLMMTGDPQECQPRRRRRESVPQLRGDQGGRGAESLARAASRALRLFLATFACSVISAEFLVANRS